MSDRTEAVVYKALVEQLGGFSNHTRDEYLHELTGRARDAITTLTAENERLKALQDDDGELLTIAWMDGSHRSTKAHRAEIERLTARVQELEEALRKLRDCDWVITPLDRMDAVRDIARAALKGEATTPAP